jgi:hypothetical protein
MNASSQKSERERLDAAAASDRIFAAPSRDGIPPGWHEVFEQLIHIYCHYQPTICPVTPGLLAGIVALVTVLPLLLLGTAEQSDIKKQDLLIIAPNS